MNSDSKIGVSDIAYTDGKIQLCIITLEPQVADADSAAKTYFVQYNAATRQYNSSEAINADIHDTPVTGFNYKNNAGTWTKSE